MVFTAPTEILKVFHYYSLFKHPLSVDEVVATLPMSITRSECESAIEMLKEQGLLLQKENYYALANQPEALIKRIENNALNQTMLQKAHKMAALVYRIPFVRAVGLSGSLSKHGATPDADIDFFIITAPQRVWVVKALLILYKKLFLGGSHKFLCVNYIVSEKALAIKNENIFKAIEMATIIPLFGSSTFKDFYTENNWVKEQFPNWKSPKIEFENKPPFSKHIAEALLSIAGKTFNGFCLKQFRKHAVRKFGQAHTLSLVFEPEVSKYFPVNAQTTVMEHMAKFNANQFQTQTAASLELK